MKKLFLAISLIISVFALSAQSFTVNEKESGNVVTSGATYHVWGDGSEFSWGYPGGQLEAEFIVTATSNIAIVCEKVANNDIPGTTNDFCLGLCFAPSVNVSPAQMMATGETLDFSAHYLAENYFDVLGMQQSMTYYLYDNNNPEERFVINVIFQYSMEGVEDISGVEEFSNAYPVPASDVVNFDYSFNSNVSNAMVAVYNMMGQEVLRSDINSMSGKLSLNVSDLADGVYFYSLIVNGKTEKSNKLVVRH